MDPNDWLEVIRREYLDDFIPAGGAAIKFVVPADAAGRGTVQQGLREAAETLGYTFAALDAETTKLHLVDKLFHAVARQVDWDTLTRAYLARTLADMGYRSPDPPETPPSPGRPEMAGAAQDGRIDALTVDRLATANDVPAPMLLSEVRRGLWHRLLRDYALAREFRLAMLRLCLSHLDPADEPLLADAVKQWLWGDLRLISAVKPALIFQRIARHNARHMLFSLARWLALAGRRGLALYLDVSRYADTTRPAERGPGFYYSTAACMDLYEVLRQLIDATDELEHCFAGVAAAPEFLTDDRRGLRSYQALYMRIADEVRDRYRANPRSSLVRLASAPANGAVTSVPAPAEAGAA
jgi:hypothetical protein